MNWTSCLALCTAFLAAVPFSHAQSGTRKGGLDPLIDWKNPWSLTLDKFKQIVDPMGVGEREPIYTVQSSRGYDHYNFNREANPGFKFDVLGGRVLLQGFTCTFEGQELMRLSFFIGQTNTLQADPKDVQALKDEITKEVGGPAPVGYRTTVGEPSNSSDTGFEWMQPDYLVRLYEVSFMRGGGYRPSGRFNVVIYRRGTGPYAARSITERAAAQPKSPEITANLDALLNFAAFWQWSPDEFEKTYTAKAEKEADQKAPPQFEWLSANKDRARFSRHMYGNVETKLTMFGGSIKVEEAVIEFVNGKAARATVSFYNRGDSGDIETKEFERIFKTVGQNLGQVTKVAPRRQIMSSNAALPVTGWMWSAPTGIALLEHNEYNTPGKVSKPEFLRLKLAAPNQADWSMGKLAVGIQRMELLKRVTKTPEGDVYISGVPMVDQGQKGYCVAASCQRLFEFMRIPCDQHEMAKLVSVDAESGADIMTMQKSLAKIDGAFKVAFKPLVNPELYYSANRKRRVSEKEFVSLVKEYTDKGVPLLWGLALGQKPENPPLPNGGQVSGGHMRLIIGYNAAKNQLIFTDSWGAGHELKRMEMLDAYDVTMGMYSMAPRGL